MRKIVTWFVLIIVILGAAGGGYVAYSRFYAPIEEPQEPELQTAQVSRGDLVVSSSGSGTLLPASEVNIGFSSGGLLAEMLVEVGDRVQTGDVIARLDDIEGRRVVANAELKVAQAEATLATQQDPVAAQRAVDLAQIQVTQAEINLASGRREQAAGQAEADLEVAQTSYEEVLTQAEHKDTQLISSRINLKQALTALSDAQEAYDTAWDPARDWELSSSRHASKLESERESTARNLERAYDDLAIAQANYDLAVIGFKESDVQNAWIKVVDAQIALDDAPVQLQQLELSLTQAQINLEEALLAVDTTQAELSLVQAQLDLEAAQRTLAQTTLVAPIDGTVMDVLAQVGENVGSGAIVALADLDTPIVQFWVEEADMSSVVVSNRVEIIFEALPDDTFSGQVTRVGPALVTVDNTLAVEAWASVDLTSSPVSLLSGMTVEIEVISGEATDALLVPVQALRQLSPGNYGVFVVDAGGELTLRIVELGLKDFVNAEVLSGLEAGDVVSTGTATSSSEPVDSPAGGGGEQPGGGGFFRFLGG